MTTPHGMSESCEESKWTLKVLRTRGDTGACVRGGVRAGLAAITSRGTKAPHRCAVLCSQDQHQAVRRLHHRENKHGNKNCVSVSLWSWDGPHTSEAVSHVATVVGTSFPKILTFARNLKLCHWHQIPEVTAHFVQANVCHTLRCKRPWRRFRGDGTPAGATPPLPEACRACARRHRTQSN